jgi:sugar lactone lactonase YvrE
MNKAWFVIAMCVGLSVAALAQGTKQDRTTQALWVADRKQAREAYDRKDWAAYRDGLLQYHKDFPGSSRALKDLGTAEALLGNDDAAVKWFQQYVERGLILDLQKPELANLRSKGRLDGIEKTQQGSSRPIGKSASVFRLSPEDLVAEDIAYDSSSKSFFISSVRQRKIVRCDASGKCADFITRESVPSLWAVFALRADTTRGVLWATTASQQPEIEHKKSEEGKSALLKFDLKTGKLLKRYEPQNGTQRVLGDMVVGRNGDVFVADSVSGDVFVVLRADDNLQPLVPAGTFLSPQTPALSEDGKTLFVADYPAGVAMVNLSNRSVIWMGSSVPVAMDGTDGLYYSNGWLIAVQNGVEPERIARFHLKGDQVDRCEVLESKTPGLGDPTHGVLVGDEFYFIANSGWDRVQDDGTMKAGEAAEIRKVRIK